MTDKISLEQYHALLFNPETSEEEIEHLSKVVRGEDGFSITIVPDPDLVEMDDQDIREESAMGIGNGWCRWRRQSAFRRRRRRRDPRPVLVSEGDSWFQFPFLIREVIDHLGADYNIWSVGAAGDTAKNMVFGPSRKKKTEYLRALRTQKDSVQAFLFSGAGNDIIGEVEGEDGKKKSALQDIIRPFNGQTADIHGHINFAVLGERIGYLRRAYNEVVTTIRAEPGFEQLPILIHGYDYVFPYPFGDGDSRSPRHAKKDEWLGEPFKYHKIMDPEHRRSIVKVLIDTLYQMLEDVSGNPQESKVWVVNCRGAMPNLTDWVDEIHGTSAGFAGVASRFKKTLVQALA